MAYEYPTYRETLNRNRERAEKLGIYTVELNQKQAAVLVGRCEKTIRRITRDRGNPYGFINGVTTVEKISRAQSREP